MRTKIIFLGFIFTGLGMLNHSCNKGDEDTPLSKAIIAEGRTDLLFDADWRFYRGNVEQAEQTVFDDSSWRILDLPHDWSIEDIPGTSSPIDSNANGGIDAGYLVGGTGWYRKTFILPRDVGNRQFFLQFDGVYMNADIWLNGRHLGNHPYGYTSIVRVMCRYLLILKSFG